MYNNVYIKRNNIDEEESVIPKKQISIVKSTHSNTRNSNNYYEKDNNNNSTLNNHQNKQAMSIRSGAKELNCKRYMSKDKKVIIPTKVLVQQMIMNSNKMLRFTSRIKENLGNSRNIPYQVQTQKQYLKQNSQRNKVSSINFDQISLYKKSDLPKSRNQYSQRDYKHSNVINNNSFLRGNSVEKQPVRKTIDFISRNKMCSFSSSNKQKTTLSHKYKNKLQKENSNISEVTVYNYSRNINNNSKISNISKANKQTQCLHSNYAQKYLKKILRNSFEINKRIQSSNQANHIK